MGKRKDMTSGDERKAQLLECGAKLAAKHGAANVTRRMVAKACKVSEALVAHYMGAAATAQKAYAKHAKKLGLALPDKAKEAELGAKLRAHGPRDKRDTRKRSVKEVEAIKRKATTAKKSARSSTPATKRPATAAKRKATSKKPTGEQRRTAPTPKTLRKSAARAPKAPPPLLAEPAPLPPLPPPPPPPLLQ